METAGTEVEALLIYNTPLLKEAWIRMRGCYLKAEDQPPPPERVAIARMTAERVALYQRVLHPGRSIPVAAMPFLVDESVPDKEKVPWAVCRFYKNRAGGPYRMREEHLWAWLGAATIEEPPNLVLWEKFIGLIQDIFHEGHLT